MQQFAQALGALFRRVVVNGTGLQGVFDVKLDYALASLAPQPGIDAAGASDVVDRASP